MSHNTSYCLIDVVTKAVLTVYKQVSSFVGDVYVPALWQHAPLNSKRRYPVVIFSHGIGGNRTCNTTVCCELASQGYIVAAVEHR